MNHNRRKSRTTHRSFKALLRHLEGDGPKQHRVPRISEAELPSIKGLEEMHKDKHRKLRAKEVKEARKEAAAQ